MNINIYGVAKSGTTILYAALQKIMRDQLPGETRFYYEPFLRDSEFVGELYENSVGKFKYIDSISAEGIFNHITLPMLIINPKQFLDNPFLHKLYGTGRRKGQENRLVRKLIGNAGSDQFHRLIKYNRANGRYRLIDSISAPSKSIFIIRNPLDVANSIKDKFSFYGGEFHRDDENRFIEEVNSVYKTKYSSDHFGNYLDTQLFYWYYMNRFALQSFQDADKRTFVICYEYFFANLERSLSALCDYLGFLYKEEYLEYFSRPAGPVTKSKKLHQSEIHVAKEYLDRYLALLNEHEIAYGFDESELLGSFTTLGAELTQKNPYYGLHGRAIENQISNSYTHLQNQESAKETQSPIKPVFLHIVNPVIVDESSDLFTAQPITFRTMEDAKDYAETKGVSVSQVAVFYEEDEAQVPRKFGKCRALDMSCQEFQSFSVVRKLPLFHDIFQRAFEYSDADYVIYTNVDIALMPHFYLTADDIMKKGYDAITICRRTLDKKYSSIESLPEMYADLGKAHSGTDCFIIRRNLLSKLDMQKIVIGSKYCAFALRANLHIFSSKIAEFPGLHMTFHVGDDRAWENKDEYSAYNASEVDKMFEALFRREDVVNAEELEKFHADFQSVRLDWKKRRGLDFSGQ